MDTINKMEFSEWINKKFMTWRGDSRRTISEFAAMIGVSQPLMSKWMKRDGPIPTSKQAIDAIAAVYPDVYEVLGLSRPKEKSIDEKYEELLSILDELTDDRREDVLRYARSVLGANEKSSTERKTKPRAGTASA